MLAADFILAIGVFAFDLVRVDDLVAVYRVTKVQAKAFLLTNGAVPMTRYCEGLARTGIRPVRLWAVRNMDWWIERGPKARTLAYFENREAN